MSNTPSVQSDQTNNQVPDNLCPKVARPDWVASAVTDTINNLAIIRDGKLPDVLQGVFLRTSALRLLRCVYGSDEATAREVPKYINGREQEIRDLARKLGWEPEPPLKCLNCDGNGIVEDDPYTETPGGTCKSCEGTGVVPDGVEPAAGPREDGDE